MKFRDWLELVIFGAAGAGTLVFFKWLYPRLKQGKFDKLLMLTKEEKKDLMEDIEEFIKNSEEK